MRAEIISWNPINTNTSVLHACVYIKPTLDILEFFNRSPNHKGVVKIGGTSSCYDNQNMFAYIEKSSDIPNTRDNFYNSTGLYVIVLNTLWYGFPEKKGYVEFQEGIVDDIISYVSGCKDDVPVLNKNADKESSEEVNLNTSEEKKEVKEGYKSMNYNRDDRDDMDDMDDRDSNSKVRCGKEKDSSRLDKNILLLSGLSILLILIISMNS